MNNVQNVSKNQLMETWVPIIEKHAGKVELSEAKQNWLVDYCHIHASNDTSAGSLFENQNATLGNVPGMGAVAAPSNPSAYGAGSSIGGNQGTIPNVFYNGAAGSGDKMPTLLPLAIRVAANTIAFDLVNVIPMATPAGMLAYLDYVYADGKLDGTGADAKPLLIEVDVQADSGQEFVNGTQYYVRETTPGDPNVAIFTFVDYSRISGRPIFRVTETQAGLDVAIRDIFTGGSTPYAVYADPAVNTTTVISGANIAGKTAELAKGMTDHFAGFSGAGSQNMDDWQGSWASHQAGNYDAVSPQGATNGRYAAPMSREVGESTYYNAMAMKLFSKLVHAQTVQVALNMTTEQIQDFKKNYGVDVVSLGETALIDQLTQHINKHILGRMFAMGWSNHTQAFRTEGIDLNLHIGANGRYSSYIGKDDTVVPFPATGNPPNAIGGGAGILENQHTIQRRISSRMIAAGNVIANRGRRGPANGAVMGSQLASALQDISGYITNPMNNTVSQKNGNLYPVGTVAGMTAYVDPNMRWTDSRICAFRKGDDPEPGIKFMPYLMAESIQTIAEGTMSPKIAVKSRYAVTEAGHSPETQYLTFDVTADSGTISFI